MKLFLFAALVLTQCALSQSTQKAGSRHNLELSQAAVSKVTWVNSPDGRYPVTDSTTFQYLYERGLMLKQRIVSSQYPGTECCISQLTVTGSDSSGKLWRFRDSAQHGEVQDDLYQTVSGGCCGSHVRYHYFDLIHGKRRFSATQTLANLGIVEGGEALERYFAVDELSEADSGEFAVMLQFGDLLAAPQTCYITSGNKTFIDARIDIQYLQDGKQIDSVYRSAEGEFPREFSIYPPGYPKNAPASVDTITGFSFVLIIHALDGDDKDRRIEIPVIKGQIALDRVTLPPGFTLGSLPPKGYDLHDEPPAD